MSANTLTAESVLSNASIRFSNLPKSQRFLKQIETFFAQVVEKSKIDGLQLSFAHNEASSPAYRATMVMAVPGPDLRLEHQGNTLDEAWQKVCDDLMKRLRNRDEKRAARKRPEPRRMAAH